MFVCMPSLHCHIQYIDYTPHCHNCHGHIENIDTEEDPCCFCPVINFNSCNIPLLFILLTINYFIYTCLTRQIHTFKFNSKDINPTRGPPYSL